MSQSCAGQTGMEVTCRNRRRPTGEEQTESGHKCGDVRRGRIRFKIIQRKNTTAMYNTVSYNGSMVSVQPHGGARVTYGRSEAQQRHTILYLIYKMCGLFCIFFFHLYGVIFLVVGFYYCYCVWTPGRLPTALWKVMGTERVKEYNINRTREKLKNLLRKYKLMSRCKLM